MRKHVEKPEYIKVYLNGLCYGNNTCHEIVTDQIERHIANVVRTEIAYAKDEVCEHCGKPWVNKSRVYNFGCCDGDRAQFYKE